MRAVTALSLAILVMLIPLGIHSPKVRWDLPVAGPAQAWARRYRNTISTDRIAILNPGAKVVNGYQNNMPVIKMSDEHADAIIAYIKTLGVAAEPAPTPEAPE